MPENLDLSQQFPGILACLYGQVLSLEPEPTSEGPRYGDDLLRARHSVGQRDVKAEFERLTKQWKSERVAGSFVSAMAVHPSYQAIIGLGPRALPLILAELERETDHWFWALKAISREDPVPPESRGKIREMKDAWLRWGREKGYAW